MATAIAEANIINGLLFVIAANEPCPMQQTREHLMIINLLGIKNVIIVQSKVDIVGRQGALESFKQIRNFIKGSVIENAPIVPVMTNHNINIDLLLEMISNMPRPQVDTSANPFMYIARSFDINRPGIEATDISGGVVGGTLTRGMFKVGDSIEIRPGIGSKVANKEVYRPIVTTITGINNGTGKLDEARPGGLIGLSTKKIDPSFTKADGLVGSIVGLEEAAGSSKHHHDKVPQAAARRPAGEGLRQRRGRDTVRRDLDSGRLRAQGQEGPCRARAQQADNSGEGYQDSDDEEHRPEMEAVRSGRRIRA